MGDSPTTLDVAGVLESAEVKAFAEHLLDRDRDKASAALTALVVRLLTGSSAAGELAGKAIERVRGLSNAATERFLEEERRIDAERKAEKDRAALVADIETQLQPWLMSVVRLLGTNAAEVSRTQETLDRGEAYIRRIEAMVERLGNQVRSADGGHPGDEASRGVAKRIIDFRSYIADKSDSFVGRQFVFDALDRFLRESDSGYFVIRGDPGIGKSAIMAQLVRRRSYAHHFNISVEGITTQAQFSENACAQVMLQYGLAPRSTRAALADTGAAVVGVLRDAVEARPGDPVVLLIDALDEADPPEPGKNPLKLPFSLPAGAFIVVTTRRTDRVLELRAEKFRVLELQRLAWKADAFLADLCLRSEGNFMYLRHVLPAIDRGDFDRRTSRDLPRGLLGYYEHHWEKMRGADFDRFVRVNQPIIAVLAGAREPVSLKFVGRITRLKAAEVRWTVDRWNEFLHVKEVNGEARYRIYHASYRDFLASKVAD
jgi:hypothetical protein